jgi:hypothetical protein
MSVALLNQYIIEGRLIRHGWTGNDEHGRHTACLLAALSPEVASSKQASACPANIMPDWLAWLTPKMDDRGSAAAWPKMVKRYAELASKWHVLDGAAWKRCMFRSLAAIVEEEALYAKDGTPQAVRQNVVALCDRAAFGEVVSVSAEQRTAISGAALVAAEAAAGERAEAAVVWDAVRCAEVMAGAAATTEAWMAADDAGRTSEAQVEAVAGAAASAAVDRMTDKILSVIAAEIEATGSAL